MNPSLARPSALAELETKVPDELRNLAARLNAPESATLDANAWLTILRLETWVRQYIRRVHNASDTQDVADDALQQLLLAILETRKQNIVESDYLIPWCKRVVRNFVVSEQRKRFTSRAKFLERLLSAYSIEQSVEVRSAIASFIHILRSEIIRSGLTGRDNARLKSFDSWIAIVLGGGTGQSRDRKARNRIEQQCSRVRRLANQTFEQLRHDGRISEDLLHIAVGLGLSGPERACIQSTQSCQQNPAFAPGSYGSVRVASRAKLSLSTGTYYFGSLDVEPQAIVQLKQDLGPVIIYAAREYRLPIGSVLFHHNRSVTHFPGGGVSPTARNRGRMHGNANATSPTRGAECPAHFYASVGCWCIHLLGCALRHRD